jgi:hypothetical protein
MAMHLAAVAQRCELDIFMRWLQFNPQQKIG